MNELLVSGANELLRLAKTEEDLRIGFEKILEPLCTSLGIKSTPRYEKSVYAGGRSDALHGQVNIEYDKPRSFRSKKTVDDKFNKLFGYICAEGRAAKDTLFLFDPKFVGIGFDGEQIFFVQYRGDKKEPKRKFLKSEFMLIGPHPFHLQSARTRLTYLRSLSRKLLTAENLTEAFGPLSTIGPEAVSSFVDALENWSSERATVFLEEWKRLFGIVYGEQFTSHQESEVNALAELYRVSRKTDFQNLLFCVHTYFALLMKFIAAEIITLKESSFTSSFCLNMAHASKADFENQLVSIEDGWIYSKRGITNFLEGDFFCWYLEALSSPRLQDAIRSMARALSEFEPATSIISPQSTRDLLKKIYQYLVPQQVRHKLGEYYTPDWLAELILNEVGYEGNTAKRFLDPACGSGTFLVLAIQRAREYGRSQKQPPIETTKAILANIWGFDLNPLAIIAARTNYLFALADIVHDLPSIELPVYLADSVLWPETSGQLKLSPRGESLSISTSIQTFFVPKIWINDEGSLMKKAAPLVEKMARNDYSVPEAMQLFEKEGLVLPGHEEIVQSFYGQILALERQNKNGIWARFLKNAFAPMAAGRFDFVVGNPPWIRWDYLSQEYRDATLQLWKDYGLFSLKGFQSRLGGGKKDFSMLFVYASSDYYLKDRAKLGFLITQEVLKAKGAGEGFRRFQLGDKEHLKVLKAHDLVSIQPFEGAANKTAAIILKKGKTKTQYPVPYIIWSKKKGVGKISTDKLLDEVLPILQKKKYIAKPIGSNVGAWQTQPAEFAGLSNIEGKNPYKAILGANPNPYGVFWLEIKQILSNGNLIVRNLTEKGKLNILQVEETIEQDLVYPAIRGSDIKRWGYAHEIFLLMVQNPETRKPYPQRLMKNNWPRTYGYLIRFKDILLNRGSKTIRRLAENTEFYAMFGIERKTLSPYKVVWQAMSNDIYASVVSSIKTSIGYKIGIPLHTTSFFAANSESEAHYLCAVINSKPVRDFIKSFSSAGRGFGTPSVMEHVGIPKFDAENQLHQKLSRLSKTLHDYQKQDDFWKLHKMEPLEQDVDNLLRELF